MLIVYNLLVTAFFILTAPYYLVQMARREKYRAGLRQRLGIYPASVQRAPGAKRRIWFHAVSVGEVAAVTPLVRLARHEFPGWDIVLSTVTMTGQRIARDTLKGAATVIYFPLDLRFAVRRALKAIAPALIVLVETEIWPNFINAARRAGIPLAIINGRISDRSFRGYRLGRFFLRPLLNMVSIFSMQTELDAERIQAMGADAARVTVGGNMKFDCGLAPADEPARLAILGSLGLKGNQDIIVAGSTHEGEEEILLEVMQLVVREHPRAALVLVPRHPERAPEVREMAEARGFRCAIRSALPRGASLAPGTVLIVDTIGELVNIYRVATVVFVGKSLVDGGGQNVIEPATLGTPVIFGPSMHNFREAAELLLRNGGAIRVRDGRELAGSIRMLLGDKPAREELGRRAAETMAGSRGATRKNLALIKELIAKTPGH